jgi:hypothetical protein
MAVQNRKPHYEEVQAAHKKSFYITVNGAKLEIYPAESATVMKAFGKRVGNNTGYAEGWIPLNAQYQLHLGNNYSKDDVCKAAGMKVWDVAVPWEWHKQPENMKKIKSGEWAVWSYDGNNRTFGAPAWRTEIFQHMKKNILTILKKR